MCYLGILQALCKLYICTHKVPDPGLCTLLEWDLCCVSREMMIVHMTVLPSYKYPHCE